MQKPLTNEKFLKIYFLLSATNIENEMLAFFPFSYEEGFTEMIRDYSFNECYLNHDISFLLGDFKSETSKLNDDLFRKTLKRLQDEEGFTIEYDLEEKTFVVKLTTETLNKWDKDTLDVQDSVIKDIASISNYVSNESYRLRVENSISNYRVQKSSDGIKHIM